MSRKVSAQEKEEMWRLYQACGTYKKVAIALDRDPGTVSRYVREIDAAKKAANVKETPVLILH